MIAKTEKTYPYEKKVAAIHKLRVNIKSLASEASFIRREEKRCGIAYQWELSSHRRGRLREESRYTHLALAFVRGRTYSSVEQKAKVQVIAGKLHEKIRRHLYDVSPEMVTKWLKN